MKILIVCQHFYPEQFRINDICFELVNRGHEVTVLTGLPNYPSGVISQEYRRGKKRKEIINGVRVIRAPLIGRGSSKIRLMMNYMSFSWSASVRARMMKKEYDVIYVYQLSPITMVNPAKIFKKRARIPMMLYCLDLWPESIAAAGIGHDSLMYKILLNMSRKLYNSADSIFTSSRSFKNYFRDVIQMDGGRIQYMPQYAEDLFSEENCNTEPGDKVNLVFAGNIGEMQSVETIILAANELRNDDNIVWHIVGNGSSLDKCKALVAELKLEDKVLFYGQRPITEMPDFYRLASAMLVTLKNNAFISYTLPGKVQSYMAAGKPIIGAINGEANEIIKESGCGLTGPAEDYPELAENVRKFAADRDSWAMYGMKSKDYYIQNFSKEVFLDRLEKELTNIVKIKKLEVK